MMQAWADYRDALFGGSHGGGAKTGVLRRCAITRSLLTAIAALPAFFDSRQPRGVGECPLEQSAARYHNSGSTPHLSFDPTVAPELWRCSCGIGALILLPMHASGRFSPGIIKVNGAS
jgi:hypothetical protein